MDSRGRFALDLPPGWRPTPAFGDTQGMVFRREVGRRAHAFALFRVRVQPRRDASLGAFIEAVEAGLSAQPGFERLAPPPRDRDYDRNGDSPRERERYPDQGHHHDHGHDHARENAREPTSVAGRPAELRAYGAMLDGEPPRRKRLLGVFVETEADQIALLFETTVRDLPLFENDRRALVASFSARGGGPGSLSSVPREEGAAHERPSAPATASQPAGSEGVRDNDAAPTVERLIGRWRSPFGSVLVLGEDRAFELAEVRGRYRLDGGRLILERVGGVRQVFTVALAGDTLTLESTALARPATYVREAEARTNTAQAASVEALLIGVWRLEDGEDSGADLVLGADLSFRLADVRGRWVVESGRVRFDRGASESIVYDFEVRDEALILSGGDLDAPAIFRRVREP